MEVCRPFGKIDRKLLPVKVHYFLFFAALACVLPFRTVFAKQLGLSATVVGVIFFGVPFFKIISNPICGFILDYFKRFRLTISVMMLIMALSHVSMVFIPPRTTVLEGNNNSDIPGHQFHSKLEYSCSSDPLSGDSEHSIKISSDFINLNTSERKLANGFTCVIECLDSNSEFLPQTKKNMNDCTERLKIEYTVSIYSSDCDMNAYRTTGKILNVHDHVPDSFVSNINESSIISLNISDAFYDIKCSRYLQNQTLPLDLNERTKEKINNSDIPRKYKDTAINTPNAMLMNSNNRSRKITTLRKYPVKSGVRNLSRNCPCKLEIGCITKRCYPNILKKDMVVSENEVQSNPIAEEKEILSFQFWSLLILITVSGQSLSAIVFMMDTVSYELMQDKSKYGQQRLWGSVGWGLGALAGGYLNQIVSSDSGDIYYAPSFYLLAVITLIDLIPVYQLKVTDIKYSSHIWKDVCLLLSKSNILYNIVVAFFIGVLSGFIWNYQFWFMEEIGANQVLLGLSQTFESIFELPWFLASGWVISKIGHHNCNSLTFLCFGIRYLCFAFMYDPWMTLPAAFIHGPTFGLFYASMTMYAKTEAPPGTEATVQSLLHLCFEGIGVGTGIILGGIGFDYFGSRMSFIYATEISFLLLFVNVFVSLIYSRSKKKRQKVENNAE